MCQSKLRYYFPLLGYTNYENGKKTAKYKQIFEVRARAVALLRDNGGKMRRFFWAPKTYVKTDG